MDVDRCGLSGERPRENIPSFNQGYKTYCIIKKSLCGLSGVRTRGTIPIFNLGYTTYCIIKKKVCAIPSFNLG